MKPLFIILITTLSFVAFSQNDTILEDEVVIERLVRLSKKECFTIGKLPDASKKEKEDMDAITNATRLPFKTLDSLFQSNNDKMKMYAFSAMSGKDVMKITNEHKKIFNDTTELIMCSREGSFSSGFTVGQFAIMTFDQLYKMKTEGMAFPYDHNIAKKDSVINDIFQTEIDFWKQLNQFDSTSIHSKKAQDLQLLHNEHYDRVYRTYMRSISDYLIESKNEELIGKFVELISLSTSSVDETQACSFVKVAMAHPKVVLDAVGEHDSHAIGNYMLDHVSMCLEPDEIDSEFIEGISEMVSRH